MILRWGGAPFTVRPAGQPLRPHFEPTLLRLRVEAADAQSAAAWLAATEGRSFDQGVALRLDPDTRQLVELTASVGASLRTIPGRGHDAWTSWPSASGALHLAPGAEAPDLDLGVASLSEDARLLMVGRAGPGVRRVDLGPGVAALVVGDEVRGVACLDPVGAGPVAAGVADAWRLWAEALAHEMDDAPLRDGFEADVARAVEALERAEAPGPAFAEWLSWL